MRFRIAAINNQIRYGICRYPDNLFLDKKSLIIIITNNIKKRIKINANIFKLNVKNTKDHNKLNIS